MCQVLLYTITLGSFPAIDTDALPKTTALTNILSAAFIGIHIGLHALSTELGWTGGIIFSKNFVFVTIILAGLVLLFLLLNTVVQAGLWGFLLRGSLIIASNVGLSIGFGMLATALGTLLLVVALLLFGLIIVCTFFRVMAIHSLF